MAVEIEGLVKDYLEEDSRLRNMHCPSNKIGRIRDAFWYIRLTYFNKPFVAVYLPSRLFYMSLWILAPVVLFNFQQLQLNPMEIQMVTTFATLVSAIYGPINGVFTDNVLKDKSYWTTVLDRTMQYVAQASRTVAPTQQAYIQAAVLEGLNGGELDWSNKYGLVVNNGKMMSTVKQIFKVINLALSTSSGFIGAFLCTTTGSTPLLALTSILAAIGITGYALGSRKYRQFWMK